VLKTLLFYVYELLKIKVRFFITVEKAVINRVMNRFSTVKKA
jgi:hypothetical protein